MLPSQKVNLLHFEKNTECSKRLTALSPSTLERAESEPHDRYQEPVRFYCQNRVHKQFVIAISLNWYTAPTSCFLYVASNVNIVSI